MKHSHLSLKEKQLTFAMMSLRNEGRKGSGYFKLASLGLLINGPAIDPVNFIVYIV